ncbi:hypothetical protein QJS10_CPB04g00614 [Acorus calamus]|uniref:Uncharacterized protein n=1 Tax=Acorus calamus TaxID=4465 RepID=A0AAV9F3R8_ACOCL|nr:hypothetical protein QJS10_CPB04g00614 [Acorus calamus]
MISFRPDLLKSNPDKTLKPKLDFLRDVGFSTPDLTLVLSKNPCILTSSLGNQIVPAYGFLKSILGIDKVIISTAKRAPWLLHTDLHKRMGSKIEFLQDHGVPDSIISAMIKHQPRCFLNVRLDRLTEVLVKLEAMDFRPSTSSFYMAISTLLSLNESLWEEKCELYRSFGWSEDDILSAFKRGLRLWNYQRIK